MNKTVKLLFAVIIAAVILLLAIVTVAGILEAREMEWDSKTIIKQEEEDERTHNDIS